MKFILALLFFIPYYSFSFCLQNFNPKYRKEVQKQDHLVFVNRINRAQTDYEISSQITKNLDPKRLLIELAVNHYEIHTKEWYIFIVNGNENCVAITSLAHETDTVIGKKILKYRWLITPVAAGTVVLKAEYRSKASEDPHIYEEKNYTIYIN